MAGRFIGEPWKQPYTAQQLQDAATHQIPIIGANGNWWRWDIETSAFVDTGKIAEGGKSPYVGDNGYWYEWNDEKREYVNTGKIASMVDLIIPGQNILLNADFRRPVNRQGKLEYAGSGYAIDRWYSQQRNAKLTVMNNCIRLENTTANTYSAILQNIDNPNAYLGKQITISLLYELEDGVNVDIALKNQNGGVGFAYTHLESGSTEWMLASATGVVPLDSTKIHFDIIILNNNVAGASINLLAAKLELCDHQTLAHQDESGNWVLNDPPNYALQYLLTSLYSPTTGEWVGIQHSNPNLLDNWYFIGGGSQQGGGQFPINQRGEAAYDSTVQSPYYCIDRYLLRQAHLQLTDDGIVLSGNGLGDPYLFQQTAPDVANALKGKTVTFSALIKNFSGDGNVRWMISSGSAASYVGTVYGETYDNGDGLVVVTTTLPDTYAYDRLQVSCRLMKQTGLSFTIVAMKLELGPVQTLARQDADGNWVLNDPPPNYAMELLKCQRYQYVIKHSGKDDLTPSWPGYISAAGKKSLTCVVLPVPLAKIPAVVYQNVTTTIRTISGYSNIATYDEPGTPASIRVESFVGNQDLVLVFAFTSGIGTNNTPNTLSLRSGQIILDANL